MWNLQSSSKSQDPFPSTRSRLKARQTLSHLGPNVGLRAYRSCLDLMPSVWLLPMQFTRTCVRLSSILLPLHSSPFKNPSRSYMWLSSWFQSLISECNLTPVHFQQCMRGGQRDKWSCFYVNHMLFQELALTCDRSHDHLPWGVAQEGDKWVFSTAQEAEYPELLRQRISSIVATVLPGQNSGR